MSCMQRGGSAGRAGVDEGAEGHALCRVPSSSGLGC